MRVSDAERDQVAEVLREAAAEGRITLEELDERLDTVYASRVYADLEPVTADLPAGIGAAADTLPAVAGGRSTALAGEESVLRSQASTVTRKGEWQVPGRLEVHNKYGTTRLDFREAVLPGPVVELYIDSSWGSAELILPEGATAEVDVESSWFGMLRNEVDALRNPPAPHFVITGTCNGGGMRIRHHKPFSWKNVWSDVFGD
nr:DUF1707 domain-containing protein [Nocardiopsis algeriensis]